MSLGPPPKPKPHTTCSARLESSSGEQGRRTGPETEEERSGGNFVRRRLNRRRRCSWTRGFGRWSLLKRASLPELPIITLSKQDALTFFFFLVEPDRYGFFSDTDRYGFLVGKGRAVTEPETVQGDEQKSWRFEG
jgi:hypothetical protein